MLCYYSLNQYLRETFGRKVCKLALSGGFSCPNRDGTCGTRGCSFCGGGSGDFAEPVLLPSGEMPEVTADEAEYREAVFAAIERAKRRVAAKDRGGAYIAYFQSFTNTYGPIEKLRKLFTAALLHPEVAALSIGTRPDCLPSETVELLKELNRKKPVWVELGLQTIHEKTALRIRRGYPLPVFDEAMRRLNAAGIYTVVHMILGLPGETPEETVETARYIGRSGVRGIKLQLLHVLRGTDLFREYEKGLFSTLSMEEYISLLYRCVEALPPEICIHRLTGDGAKKDLAAPLWSGDKKRVLNEINQVLIPGSPH